jgi:hypothetical protein
MFDIILLCVRASVHHCRIFYQFEKGSYRCLLDAGMAADDTSCLDYEDCVKKGEQSGKKEVGSGDGQQFRVFDLDPLSLELRLFSLVP